MANMDNNMLFCRGCDCTLIEFILMAEDADRLNQFLYNHGVVPKTMNCPRCEHPMKLTSDGMFACYKRYLTSKNKKKRISKQCRARVSSNSGTLFSNGRLSRKKICSLIVLWIMTPPPRIAFMCNELKISVGTCISWCRYLRDVCVFHVYHDNRRKRIGGIDKVVEIDQWKLKRERDDAKLDSWILGGIEQGSKNIFLIPVANCDSETLLQAIKEFVLPGTTIISSYWRTLNLNGLITEGFHHLTVDCRYNFVEPETGAHIQTITRLWRDVQSKIPKYGCRKEFLQGHLAEFVFKYKYSNQATRIHEIFSAIVSTYNGNDRVDNHQNELNQTLETPINHSAIDSQLVDISDLNNTLKTSNSNITKSNHSSVEPQCSVDNSVCNQAMETTTCNRNCSSVEPQYSVDNSDLNQTLETTMCNSNSNHTTVEPQYSVDISDLNQILETTVCNSHHLGGESVPVFVVVVNEFNETETLEVSL